MQENKLVGKIFRRRVSYDIEIKSMASIVPDEFEEDFIDWLKCKAVELGAGKQCGTYYGHDESGDGIDVVFYVKSVLS